MNAVLWTSLPVAGIVLGWIIRWLYARFQLSASEQRAERITRNAAQEAEIQKKEILLEAKEQLIRERNQQEREHKERQGEIQKREQRLAEKEEKLDRLSHDAEKQEQALTARKQDVTKQEQILAAREQDAAKREEFLAAEDARYRKELERISELSAEEAKTLLIRDLENDARHDAQALLNKIEQDSLLSAEKKARDVLVTTIQRIAGETTGDITVTTVPLPSDDMKGRIIGREGRNVRALETLTGVDLIVDDTPEAVVISCFDPVRREIAKASLERLVMDGRIHPGRIEEIVQKVSSEVQQRIYDEGERVLFDLGIHNISPEGVEALGRLHYRTSYGQNVLRHSHETAVIAGMLAAEVGANRDLAKRAAVLHDIGKGAKIESDQNHAEIGMDMARKIGEDPRVVNAVGAHHGDIESDSIEAVIVQIADAISAARPGARRDTAETYVKRLENLEAVAVSFAGVERAYAIQAGRELRILVNHERVSDGGARDMAKQIAKQIETDLRYPGRIKVTMIRETRVVEYAR
jgi:ribonuclease Y